MHITKPLDGSVVAVWVPRRFSNRSRAAALALAVLPPEGSTLFQGSARFHALGRRGDDLCVGVAASVRLSQVLTISSHFVTLARPGPNENAAPNRKKFRVLLTLLRLRRKNPNHWRAITRIFCLVPPKTPCFSKRSTGLVLEARIPRDNEA